MNFLAPWAFLFGAIAPVIVLLYLLKLRRRKVAVSTLLFWQKVLDQNRQTALLQRLRNPLSLLFHLLIFSLLLLAIAKPVFDSAIPSGTSTVLIIDTRARMQGRQSGIARFDEARRAALSLLRQAGPGREFAILTGGLEGRVASPFASDVTALQRVIEELSPTDSGGDLDAALQLAGDLLQSRGGERRIVVLTSASKVALPDSVSSIPVETRIFGVSAENTAITRFATRPLPADPQSVEIYLEIQHFGQQPVEGTVELSSDGRVLDVRPFVATPDEPLRVFFPAVSSFQERSKGLLTARLTREDALIVDNVAFAVLPQQKPRHVLLVTQGNWFLEKLLQADTRVRYELLSPDSFRLSMAAQFDLVVFDRFVPADFEMSEMASNSLFIGATPFPKRERIEQPIVTASSDSHPVLKGVNLHNVTISAAAALTLPKLEGWRFETLLNSFDYSLLITGESNGRRIAAMGFDLMESDLPLRVAFPLLVGNLIQWLGGERADVLTSLPAGEVFEMERATSVVGPFKEQPPSDVGNQVNVELWQPLYNGFYRLSSSDATNWVAVNTFSPADSDLRATDQGQPSVASSPWQLRGKVTGAPPWRYLAALAGLLLLVEWRLYHRRRTE